MEEEKKPHLKYVLDDLISRWEKGNVKKGAAVRLAWAEAGGEKAKKHSKPVSFKKGVLVVIAEDSSWLYKLTLEKRKILEKFNEKYTGRIKAKDIRFRIGALDD